MVPEILKRMDMLVEGGSFLGKAEEVTLPTIERTLVEYRGAGMPGPVKIPQGWNEMTLGIKLCEYTPLMLSQLEKVDISGTGLRFVGAYGGDNPGASTVGIEVVARGLVSKLDFGSAKEGEKTELETEFPLTYFKLSRNNEPQIELDFINGIEKIGTVDLAADIRQILGLT